MNGVRPAPFPVADESGQDGFSHVLSWRAPDGSGAGAAFNPVTGSMQRLNSTDFLRGFGRALDLRGAIGARRRYARRWERSDGGALASDWCSVFRDLGEAFERVKRGDRERDG